MATIAAGLVPEGWRMWQIGTDADPSGPVDRDPMSRCHRTGGLAPESVASPHRTMIEPRSRLGVGAWLSPGAPTGARGSPRRLQPPAATALRVGTRQ